MDGFITITDTKVLKSVVKTGSGKIAGKRLDEKNLTIILQ